MSSEDRGGRPPLARVFKFGLVGAAGFAIQLTAVACLTAAGWKTVPATALAVELAVLHNFWWHERWTWNTRVAAAGRRVNRLVRFHAATGVVSIAGNLLVTTAAVHVFDLGPIAANAAAVAAMALGNFHVADRWVFCGQRSFEC
jgi:putative flippase GtrA